jgi:hypothetical protein
MARRQRRGESAHPIRHGIVPAKIQTHPMRHGIVPAKIQKKRVSLGGGLGAGSGPGSWPDFLYRGGPVINNPQLYAIFLGDWTSTASQNRASRLQQFLKDLLGSSYMNILSQYGCGSTGTLVNSAFIADSSNALNDSDFQTVLQHAINGGKIPEPTPKSSIGFLLYLDDNKVVVDEKICEAAGGFGYHSHFSTTAGNPCYYGIIPGLTDSCLTTTCEGDDTGCSLHLAETQEQRQTQVTSHELAEMISNPHVALTLKDKNEAWCRPLTAVNVSPHEAGDICNGQTGSITVGPNTWNVQLMYSKWDDMNSNGVTSCVSGETNPLPSLLPACSLILDRSTFGKDEVNSLGGSATFTDALYVVLEGFTGDELGLNSGNLNSPPNVLTFSGSFPGLSGVTLPFDVATGVQMEDSTNFQTIQRITFPFNIRFTNLNAFIGIPANPGFADFAIAVTVAITATGIYPTLSVSSSSAEIELVLQADPYMTAGETFWLSNDMRVFSVTPATLPPSKIPLAYSATTYVSDPNTYIKALITELNTNFTSPATANTPFNAISPDEDQSALELHQNDTSRHPVFNFALARVHLRGDTANNVRTFFRLFISTSPDTDFNTSTTFRSLPQTDSGGNNIPGTLIPLLGFPTNDLPLTIPFFAEPRVDTTSESMTRQSDPSNVQTIPSPLAPAPGTGDEVFAYFGCYLDLNQPTARFPLNPSTASTLNGPWTPAEILSIPAILMADHACIVAEIAYDPDPIPAGANAATSDKLGQRNIAWVPSDNPGALDSHRIPTLFDIRPTNATTVPSRHLPDELMIEWGNTPVGSTASIYWPQVAADEVLALAQKFYSTRLLTKQDNNTIQCVTGSITYIPIPPGSGNNLAGLITVDLPPTVTTGQRFQIVVRRVTSRFLFGSDQSARRQVGWRYVVGAFQINIPVSTANLLLAPEESLLAVFKWKIGQIPTNNRWYPVLQRYIEQISGRVTGFGGNPQQIPPSPKGYPTGGGGDEHPSDDLVESTGKVAGLIYDRFGDFEGFTLETELGRQKVFRARERSIEELARNAWLDRYVVSIVALKHEPHCPITVILRRAPRGVD